MWWTQLILVGVVGWIMYGVVEQMERIHKEQAKLLEDIAKELREVKDELRRIRYQDMNEDVEEE